MNRRQMLSLLGTAAAGFVVAGAPAAARGDAAGREGHEGHGDLSRRCAVACYDCARECNRSFVHAHEQLAAGRKEFARCLRLCVNGAELCNACGALCARTSSFMAAAAAACARACEDCAAECERLDHPEMKACAEACRRCAALCREMSKAA